MIIIIIMIVIILGGTMALYWKVSVFLPLLTNVPFRIMDYGDCECISCDRLLPLPGCPLSFLGRLQAHCDPALDDHLRRMYE